MTVWLRRMTVPARKRMEVRQSPTTGRRRPVDSSAWHTGQVVKASLDPHNQWEFPSAKAGSGYVGPY